MSYRSLRINLEMRDDSRVTTRNGQLIELTPGTLFHVPPVPHDSWVVGDEPYVSLHFLGAQEYARKGP